MASQLASTLAGANENNLLALDPEALQANADIQLGQGMQQQGLSTAPAYAPQALARLAQALSGTYVRQQGVSNLTKALTGGIESAKQVFGPDTAIGKLLNNPNPLVQAIGFQQIPAAVKLNSEGVKLTPAETFNQFGGSRATAAGSPAQAGAVAGAEAAKRAPFEGGGTAIIQTPSGYREIPITAATRAGMQPTAQGGGVPQAPPRLAPQPPPVAAPPRAAVHTAPRVPSPAATPSPSPAAPTGALKDQSRVPPQSAIPGAVLGKPLENPGAKALIDADAKEVEQNRTAAQQGAADMANVRMIQDFLPKVQTGWGAENKLEAARILKGLGVSQDTITKEIGSLPDVAAGQILQKKFLELSAGAARGMGAREPGSVISMFAKAYPNLGTDERAVKLQTNALYMDRLRAQRLANEKTNYLNESVNALPATGQYRGLKGFNEQFNKNHAAEDYMHAAESMSGAPEAWGHAKSGPQQDAIVSKMPPNTHYLAPDGKWHITPGTGTPGVQISR